MFVAALANQRVLFLINPRSGGQRARKTLHLLKQYAAQKKSNIEIEELNGPPFRTFTPTPSDIIVIGGGDGTVSTLLPKLVELKSTVGILPLGTGNDLARELGVLSSLNWNDGEKLVNFYREALRREITYFKLAYDKELSSTVNFTNYVSFGFDAKLVAEFSRLRKRRWWSGVRSTWGNRVCYAALGIRNIMHKIVSGSPLVIKNDHGSHALNDTKSIILTNIGSIMGLGRSNLHSSVFDQSLECLAIDNVLNYLTMFSHYRVPIFHPRFIGSAERWDILNLPPDVNIQIDGEPRPDINSTNYRISPGGKILVAVGKLDQSERASI